MSLSHRLQPVLSSVLTSPRLRDVLRGAHEVRRRMSRAPHQVTAWLKLDDPYSYLLLQELPRLTQHFRVHLQLRFLDGLPEAMYPAPDLLADYALTDAQLLADHLGLGFPERVSLPSEADIELGNRILLGDHRPTCERLELALDVFAAVWGHQPAELAALAGRHPILDGAEANIRLEETRQALEAEGHYLAGTLQYGGEWYWGVDRLPHLATRLHGLGAGNAPAAFGVADPLSGEGRFLLQDPVQLSYLRGLELPLDLFFSFRSPYSYLALERTLALTRHYGLRLTIKPVLPMVMRGLALPSSKRFYILNDAKREAERLGIPFGRICDPLGPGIERCMAGFLLAQECDRVIAYLLSVARGIWAEGRNVADDREFRLLLERAGLNWADARPHLASTDWVTAAEQHRQELEDLGLWGVPVLCLQTSRQVLTVWGQDRIWAIEAAIAALAPALSGLPATDTEGA